MNCSDSKCVGDDRIRNCQCYGKDDENQFCAFEENGLLYECFPGCCEGGCPGQCSDVRPKPPYRDKKFTLITKNRTTYAKYLQITFIVILALIIASTFTI